MDTDSVAEEIIIWSDPYARWRDTRWYVASELILPTGFPLFARRNYDFETIALQLRSVLSCNPEYERSKMQVGCTIEDISIQATSIRRQKREKDRLVVQNVLDEIDRDLTGAVLQLQTNDRGAIVDLDIEGLSTKNPRERLRAETLRRVVGRLVYPFHMKLPKTIQRGTHWPEFNSEMMTMPSHQRSMGSSVIVHYLDEYEGHLLVQDIGDGQVALFPLQRSVDELIPINEEAPPIQYRMRFDGVSIYDSDTGVMKERVWAMKGRGNARLGSSVPLWYAGRIRMLGKTEELTLGPTQQISYPWFSTEGLPEWTPVDPDVAAQIEALPAR